MSAIGSVIMGSPARLDNARNLAAQRKNPEADPAEFEFTVVATWPSAYFATVVVTHREFRFAIEFCELRSTRHFSLYKSVGAERHAELLQERTPFLVCLRCRHEADVQTLDRINLVVVDFRKDDLLAQA
jgi:hypothetical protein